MPQIASQRMMLNLLVDLLLMPLIERLGTTGLVLP
jgi:hypothetical protein